MTFTNWFSGGGGRRDWRAVVCAGWRGALHAVAVATEDSAALRQGATDDGVSIVEVGVAQWPGSQAIGSHGGGRAALLADALEGCAR